MASSPKRWCVLAGVLLASIAAAAIVAVFCRPRPVEKVETATVKRGDVFATLEVEGSAESARNLAVTCRIAGGSTILWIVPDGSQVQEGDELVRFDTTAIEDLLSQQIVVVEQAKATQTAAVHELAAARLALREYVEGTFFELNKEADAAITTAEHNLRQAQQGLAAAKRLVRRGFVTALQLEPSLFAVEQAELQLDMARRAKSVLETYNRPKMTQDLNTRVATAAALVKSTTAEFALAQKRLSRYHEQLDRCVVRAPRSGLAIHANDPGRSSSDTPQIELGAFVRERQNVLWLSDVSRMRVWALVHESSVLRVRPGQPASVRVRDRELPAVVSEVANQPEPMRRSQQHLKYFMVSALIDEPSPGLRPGETVDLTLLLNYRPDVLRTPLETVVKAESGTYVWVEGDGGIEPRRIELGEVGDAAAEIRRGLQEGDRVVVNPRDNLPQTDHLFGPSAEHRRNRFGEASPHPAAHRSIAAGNAAGG